jgi:CubicO group peptidase (beta-lactamase class C family)
MRGDDDAPRAHARDFFRKSTNNQHYMHIERVAPTFLIALVTLSACSGSPPRAGASPTFASDEVAARIRQVEAGLLPLNTIAGRPLPTMPLDDRMRYFNVPGVSIAVVNNGAIEWAKGYGAADAESGRPVDTATLFQAASISKPVAAIGALHLVEKGRLALDEDVNERLTSWRVPASDHARGEKVTLRRIITHNAGLTVHGFRGYAQGEGVPAVVQVLNGTPPANSAPVVIDTQPGSVQRYSGGGVTVAQLLMSDVTGEPFPRLMEELVLRPAGMVHSTYEQPLPAALAPNAATAHRRDGTPVAGKWHTYPEQAAAGLWTTPSDLARLMIAVQRWAGGAEGGVISPAMSREMLTPQGSSYGLGFGLGGEGQSRIFAHGGSNVGFRAMFIGFVETGQGAVVMTNGDMGDALVQEIVRSISRVYGWQQFKTTEKKIVSIDPATLQSFTGQYRIDSSGGGPVLTVSLADGSLQAKLPNWLSARTLYPSAPNQFFMLETGAELTFERDGTAQAGAVVLSGGGPPTRAIRVE